jgi:hypothetical protein
VIIVALLLQSTPIIGYCSTRANNCGWVQHRIVSEDAQRCGVTVKISHSQEPYIADGASFAVVIEGNASAEQRACVAEAVRTAQSRPYGSKK